MENIVSIYLKAILINTMKGYIKMKYKCINKRCSHEGHFQESDITTICPCCNSPMLNIESIVKQDSHFQMLKNVEYFGVQGTYAEIDRLIHNPLQRVKYRQLLEQTVKQYNLKG